MKEGDPFSFRSEARYLVDEADSSSATALERPLEIVDVEADVMNARATLGDELADGRLGSFTLEKFNERFAGDESRNAGTVRIIERSLGHAEDVAVEWQDLLERTNRHTDVGDSRSAKGSFDGCWLAQVFVGRC